VSSDVEKFKSEAELTLKKRGRSWILIHRAEVKSVDDSEGACKVVKYDASWRSRRRLVMRHELCGRNLHAIKRWVIVEDGANGNEQSRRSPPQVLQQEYRTLSRLSHCSLDDGWRQGPVRLRRRRRLFS
jgi:hypothetical protein